ncbi:MAG: sulfatase family protein [Acidimicrobiia bacterium]
MPVRRGDPHLARLCVWSLVLTCVGSLYACNGGDEDVGGAESDKPNIVLIVSDDQRWDSVDEMPAIDERTNWARFTNAFVNDPQCCPSRATILTGRYTQNTGVTTLRDGPKLDERRTVATMLHDAGYRTGFVGKYVNGYPFHRGHYIPPGWDTFAGNVLGSDYFSYTLNENGTLVEYGTDAKDYSTDVLARKAREFIAGADYSQPLFLYAAFNAPHFSVVNGGYAFPAERHRGACEDRTFELPANFNAYDTVDEPEWMSAAVPVGVENNLKQRVATCETLQALDEGVISILDELAESGRLENTYVVFTSDNGYSFGEHRLGGKGHLYEDSIRVPLLVSGPEVKPGTVDRLTSNVDLLPTILDWASTSAPEGFVDGASFASVLRGKTGTDEPQAVLLRGCRTGIDRSAPDQAAELRAAFCGGYREKMGLNWGLRTATHKYIEYPNGDVQLFDLRSDPLEITNLASDPTQAQLIAELHDQLASLRRE